MNIRIKKARFFLHVLGRNIRPGHLPYKAHLILTWKCQSRCIMCDIWKRKPGNELTLEEWTTFFKANPYLRWITFSGGEPFLRPDLAELVAAAARHCPQLYYINTPTNSLAPEKILDAAEKIAQLPIPEYVLSISLDGPPEVHNRVRGVPTAWERAMTVLTEARRLQERFPRKFQVMIEHTLLPPAYGRFNEMVDAVREKVPGIDAGDIMVAGPNVSEHYYGNAAVGGELKSDRKEDMEAALLQILEARRRHGQVSLQYLVPQYYLELYRNYAATRKPPMRCRATRSTIFIDPEGTVYPCNGWNRKLGLLREADYSLERILGRPDMAALRKGIDRFACGGCWTPCEASVSIGESVLHPCVSVRLAALAGKTLLARNRPT